ncbi:MAG: hypothetical protein J6L83_05575 [Clostridia bacterium]|nr:hypothetical protein [Clostridia bacterium]
MKYQITCPVCHHEWSYDNGYYDKNIARLGVEIQDIILQLQKHKQLPKYEQYQRTEWWLSAKKALTEKQKELAELKALRKQYDQQRHRYEYQKFKELTREYVGEIKFQELLKQVELELEAYTMSDLMRHEYTRSKSQSSVTSINKL